MLGSSVGGQHGQPHCRIPNMRRDNPSEGSQGISDCVFECNSFNHSSVIKRELLVGAFIRRARGCHEPEVAFVRRVRVIQDAGLPRKGEAEDGVPRQLSILEAEVGICSDQNHR